MKSLTSIFLPSFFFLATLVACSSNDEVVIDDTPINTIASAESCSNVVIVNGHAYGACGDQLEVISLKDNKRNVLQIPADDISVDASTNTLFIQARNSISALNVTNPLAPNVLATNSTRFGLFSGIGAANGVVVTSGGTRGQNTQVFRFNDNSFRLTANGIDAVDNVTGNPDVHVTETLNGARAFYSQDLGSVANWGIQIVDFNNKGAVVSTEEVVVLTSQRFSGGFTTISPANFPVESEFLNNKLYVAHFAANGIEVVDFNNNTSLSTIDLGYQPVHITTDGVQLFAIGLTSKVVSVLNPNTEQVTSLNVDAIEQARGIAASNDYIVIADRAKGLIVVNR